MQLFLISGLSGSGKSVALKVLEDSGYYCVDNLPADLLTALVEHLQHAGYNNIAVSIDVRSANSVQRLPDLLQQIRQHGVDVHVLFLDAQNDTLVKRFSETRRLHPLSDSSFLTNDKTVRTLPECVSYERELLAADQRHRPSHRHHRTQRQCAARLDQAIHQGRPCTPDTAVPVVRLQARHTAGFRPGVRCALPAQSALRPGCCARSPDAMPPVIDFLENTPAAQKMFGDIRDFVERWLPSFVADNRSYLTVAIGCTGGQHRSVYLAEKLARHFEHQQQVLVRHRELTQ